MIRKLLFTLVPLALALASFHVPIPGVDDPSHYLGRDLADVRLALSLGSIGLGPLITGSLLVALISWLVPGLRARREEPPLRRKLWLWSLIVAMLVAAMQAWGVTTFLLSLSYDAASSGLVSQPGIGWQLHALVSLMAAAAMWIALAELVTRHGLGNGVVLLWVGSNVYGWAQDLPTSLVRAEELHFDSAVARLVDQWAWLPATVLVVVVVLSLAREQRRLVPAPGGGLVGAGVDTLAATVVASAASFGLVEIGATEWSGLMAAAVTTLAAAVAGYVLTLLFHPVREVAMAARVSTDVVAAERNAAALQTAVVVAGLALLYAALQPLTVRAPDVLAVALLTAWIVDASRDARLDGVLIGYAHTTHRAEALRRELADDGIELTVGSALCRRLLGAFGPFVPMPLTVPSKSGKRAAALVAEVTERARQVERTTATPGAKKPTEGVDRAARPGFAAPAGVLAAGVVLLFALPALLAVGGTDYSDIPPARLELLAVDDELELFEPLSTSPDLPAGVDFEYENAPIGPGRSTPRMYAVIRSVNLSKDVRGWLDGLALPANRRIGLSKVLAYDEETETLSHEGWRTYVMIEPAAIDGHVVSAMAAVGDWQDWYVMVELDDEGAAAFEQLTRDHVRRRIAIVLDGEVMSVPEVREPISGGSVRITMGAGSFEQQREDANELAAALRSSVKRE